MVTRYAQIRIIDADPPNPAAPDTWLRTASAVDELLQRITLDSVLSVPAFDTDKRYYVEFDDYAHRLSRGVSLFGQAWGGLRHEFGLGTDLDCGAEFGLRARW